MKTKTINLYTFDELSEESKEKAREWYKENMDYPDLTETVTDAIEAKLESSPDVTNFDITKVYYSLSYCQGDGAMFEGQVFFEYEGTDFVATIRHNGNYYHERSTSIGIELFESDDDEIENYAELEKYFEEEIYIPACIAGKKAGYSEIEYQDSDEVVDDLLQVNEYTFTEDGKRMN